MRLLSVDFGTSNTVAALLVDGQAPRTVTFDTSPLLPSSVFVAADGSITVGRDAQRLARLDPARFEPNPKRRIDDGDILLGDRILPVVDVLAAVLRVVAIEVRRQLGGAAPDEVRLTHPAQWGATRRNLLASAARAAGLGGNLVLLPEPVAAAAQFTQLPGRTLSPGGAVAVYDLGGGTFDIAVVGRTRSGGSAAAGVEGEFTVLAEAGLADLGGLDFDQAILDQVGRMASAADPARWQQILRPQDASGRRAARTLAEDVRAAKETLSRYPQTDVSLPDPFVDAHLTRTEFEGLIRPNLLRSIEVLSGTLRSAGIAPEQLSGIFLVGGSSRIPLVAALIQDRLRVTPVTLDQPETAVALGALLVPVRRDGARTVVISDAARPSPPFRPHAAGPAGPAGSGQVDPLTGTPFPAPAATGPQPVQRPPGRRRLLTIGAGVAVVLAAALVLLLVRPFGSAPAAAPVTTPVTPVSTGLPTSPAVSRASGTGPTTSPTSGLGPGGVFTSGEVAFLAGNVSRLGNCTDFSSTFDGVVPSALRAVRAIRCSVGDADATDLGGPVLVYVVTAADPAAYLNTLVQDKRRHSSGLSTSDTDARFTGNAAAGRVITAYDLPALGKSTVDPTEGASVLAWTIDGQPYVGLVVSLGTSLQKDLTNYWAQNFQPRG